MIAFVLIASCTAATVFAVLALGRAARRRDFAAAPTPPLTVLKPLAGADDALPGNLATFFAQDYPDFELVFGVVGADDKAVPVVRALMAAHPRVRARLVIHDGSAGLNPKVANLRAMLAAGGRDVVVVSDSNVAVSPRYLRSMAARLEPGVGLVTSLFAGVGERTLGARLENLHLCGSIAPAVAASEVLRGDALVVGKSLLFRRSVFEELGGMESLASVLAEDYVMGRMFTEAGLRVVTSTEIIRNVNVAASVWAFVRRQARWGLMRSRLKPLAYPFEPLANPVAVALAALALGAAPLPVAVWALALAFLRDAAAWLVLRGPRGLAAAAPLGLLKDALVLGAWLAAPWKRRVSWRGNRLRISAGTRLYQERA
jgi:ceramide glucosyltransferase